MIVRNLIILLTDGILGGMVGLELKFALLGKLFIEPYHSLMPVAWGLILFLWLLVQIPVMRKWWWPTLGSLLSIVVATGIVLGDQWRSLNLELIYTPAIALVLLLLSVIFAAVPVERSSALQPYLPEVKSKKIRISSPAGPFWLLFSLVLGIIFGITLYHNWIPLKFLSFFNSPELFRLILYVFYAALSGFISISPGWGAFSSFMFVLGTEFTFLFLYTAYASLQQLYWEIGAIFLDPARVSAPAAFLVISFIWGWFVGHYSHLSLVLKEAKLETELETQIKADIPQVQEEGKELAEPQPEKKICKSCGASIDKEAQFCPMCGAKQSD